MRKLLTKAALVFGALFAVLVLVSLLGGGESKPEGAGATTAWAYVEHLRAGHQGEAEALWAPSHREAPAPVEASRAVGPLLEAADFVKFTSSLTAEDRACHFGGIGRSGKLFDDISHSVRIYLVRIDGSWRIDAVQAYGSGPAPVPPWPEDWHPHARRSSCGSGYP